MRLALGSPVRQGGGGDFIYLFFLFIIFIFTRFALQVGFIQLKQLMSKETLAPEPQGCLEGHRWDWPLWVVADLKAVLCFSALGFRSYERGCPGECTSLQPARHGVSGQVSLSPIFKPPQGAQSCCCLFGNQTWIKKIGRDKGAEEG